ncbi:MAG: PhzF family phenazine biosynthesis protein [Solirubrobacteraceae bacterium]
MILETAHPYTVLDVFTDRPLTGNPLAVFTDGERIPTPLMQALARELHLSETVFLLPGDDQADAEVRIFTPASELPFAGHPVLGAAFVLGAARSLSEVRLRTGAGVVPVRLTRDSDRISFGEMEQPLPTRRTFERSSELLEALGLTASLLPVEAYTNGPTHVMVAVPTVAELAVLEPDLTAITGLGTLCVNCFAASEPLAPAGASVALRCRVFCPGLGVPEDPATGSAAGPLGWHALRHGWALSGQDVRIVQGVEIGRPSVLHARVQGAPDSPGRNTVGGSAVVVAHGHFQLA